jgi:hypothetical protein
VKARISGVPGTQEPQVEIFIVGLEMLRRLLPRIGPYVLVEIVLPGGTLLALLLYLYRRRTSSIGQDMGLRPLRTAMASTAIFAKGSGSPV